MKRLLRWSLNSIAGLSAVLCIGTAGFWVRSTWRQDAVVWFSGPTSSPVWGREIELSSAGGRVGLRVDRWFVEDQGHVPGLIYFTRTFDPQASRPGFWGFHSEDQTDPYRGRIEHFSIQEIPYWFLLILFAAVPGGVLWRHRLAPRERRRGLCTLCGYDLRATPDRCPECGTAVAPARAA